MVCISILPPGLPIREAGLIQLQFVLQSVEMTLLILYFGFKAQQGSDARFQFLIAGFAIFDDL